MIKMTRQQYQQKYGVAPSVSQPTITPQPSAQPIQMTRAQYAQKYGQSVAPKTLGGFAGNVLKSGGRLIGDTVGAVANIFNPNMEKNTLANIAKLTTGAVQLIDPTQGNKIVSKIPGFSHVQRLAGDQEQTARNVGQFYKDRYGGWENIKNTLYNDPVGALADVASVATGAGGALRGGASVASKIGSVSKAGKVAQVGKVASNIGRTIDPIMIVGKGIGAVGGKISSKVKPALFSRADDMITAGIGNTTQQAKAAQKYGRSVASFIDEYNLYDRSPETAGQVVKDIGERFDTLAMSTNKNIQVNQIIKAFDDEIAKLSKGTGGVIADATAQKIAELQRRRQMFLDSIVQKKQIDVPISQTSAKPPTDPLMAGGLKNVNPELTDDSLKVLRGEAETYKNSVREALKVEKHNASLASRIWTYIQALKTNPHKWTQEIFDNRMREFGTKNVEELQNIMDQLNKKVTPKVPQSISKLLQAEKLSTKDSLVLIRKAIKDKAIAIADELGVLDKSQTGMAWGNPIYDYRIPKPIVEYVQKITNPPVDYDKKVANKLALQQMAAKESLDKEKVLNALYSVNKRAKEIRDNQAKFAKTMFRNEDTDRYFTGSSSLGHSILKRQKTRGNRLYQLKDEVIRKMAEIEGIKPKGYHLMGDENKYDLWEIGGYRFHTPNATSTNPLGEITGMIDATRKRSIPPRRAELILKEYLSQSQPKPLTDPLEALKVEADKLLSKPEMNKSELKRYNDIGEELQLREIIDKTKKNIIEAKKMGKSKYVNEATTYLNKKQQQLTSLYNQAKAEVPTDGVIKPQLNFSRVESQSSPLNIPMKQATEFRRRVIDPDVPPSMYGLNPKDAGKAGGVKEARNIFRSESIKVAPELEKLGLDYGMAKELEKILTNSQFRKNNRQLFNFTKMGGGGLGGLAAGAPGVIAGFALEQIVNNPVFIKLASKGLKQALNAKLPQNRVTNAIRKTAGSLYQVGRFGRLIGNQTQPKSASTQTLPNLQLENFQTYQNYTPQSNLLDKIAEKQGLDVEEMRKKRLNFYRK